MPDAVGISRRPGTNFVRESVYGLWGRSGDLVIRGCDDFSASQSAVLFGPKRRELDHIRVEIHQKGLEPAIMSKENAEESANLHPRHERHVWDFDNLPLVNMFLMFLANLLVLAGNRKWVE